MSAAYNSDRSWALIVWARHRFRVYPPGDPVFELADQLEAARQEVERLVDVIRDARSQVIDWNNTTMFTLARANLAVTLDDAIDAYRAAKGKP